MNQDNKKVPRRIAQAILNSLKGGVVPRIGLPYIAVGRKNEIEALLHDVDIIAEGGASFRFIVGRYGSGKSFLIQTIRNYVMDKGFIVADADLSPERRLQTVGTAASFRRVSLRGCLFVVSAVWAARWLTSGASGMRVWSLLPLRLFRA